MEYRRISDSTGAIETTLSHFKGDLGSEYMLHSICTDHSLSFEEQLVALVSEVARVSESVGGKSVIRRLFLSDTANQTERTLVELQKLSDCATSTVEQPPLSGAKIASWVYIQEGVEVEKIENGLYSAKNSDGVTHLWGGMTFTDKGDSHTQMKSLFEDYTKTLELHGCTLIDNCIRTWLFVQNVDVNYAGVVTGRNEVFDREGLTPDTHFISSTGIQGRHADHKVLVQMDTYAVSGISQEQIQFLYAPTHLNPTHEYGVSFERGTAVHYSDRSHAFISGTASINNKGEVVHVGDIKMQTLRMWENVEKLLSEADFTMEDMAHMIVYLRDIGDYELVSKMFAERFPDTPMIIVLAPVCRPTWLIEMECIAIRGQK